MTSPIAICGRPAERISPNCRTAISRNEGSAKLQFRAVAKGAGRGGQGMRLGGCVTLSLPALNLSRVLPGWSHLALHVCQDTRKHVAKLFRSLSSRAAHRRQRNEGVGHSAVKA
jgi:hypothetical protein